MENNSVFWGEDLLISCRLFVAELCPKVSLVFSNRYLPKAKATTASPTAWLPRRWRLVGTIIGVHYTSTGYNISSRGLSGMVKSPLLRNTPACFCKGSHLLPTRPGIPRACENVRCLSFSIGRASLSTMPARCIPCSVEFCFSLHKPLGVPWPGPLPYLS